jgi:ABC-type polysaccharide/polyol phosphate transport system ATPase subunit
MIIVKNASLEYPILDVNSHSLQLALYSKLSNVVGGKFSESTANKYVMALDDISLEIKDGTRLGIIGHNGAGKTTLLRLISGVYTPTTGHVSIKGDICSLTDFSLGMDQNVSGIKNIIFRLVFMGKTFSQAKKAVDEIVDFSEIGAYAHMPIRTYSTGMFLRLAFAISTHFIPDILVLDEVIGAGDEGFKVKMKQRLEQIINKSRIVILSSHDLAAVKQFCNSAILLRKGQIICHGKVSDVVAQYLNA